jgi:hypothetical protein
MIMGFLTDIFSEPILNTLPWTLVINSAHNHEYPHGESNSGLQDESLIS